MKTRVTGKNPDGSPHTLYTPEGMSGQLLQELWELREDKTVKYPISLLLGHSVIHVENRRDFQSFLFGLQTGFDMNTIF